MKLRIIKSIFLLFYAFGLNAQMITIQNKETAEAVDYASIYNQNKDLKSLSSSDGRFETEGFSEGDTLVVQHLAYETGIFIYGEKLERILLTPKVFEAHEVIVSASKWEENELDINHRISSVKRKDFLVSSGQTTADLLSETGEVLIQKSQQGGGSPIIRGFSANRLLYSVDGVRLNNAIFRSGNLHNVLSLDALSIEKAEVLFGGQSVQYGSDAIGAVMSFQTLSAQRSFLQKPSIGAEALFRTASVNNERTFHANLGWKSQNIGLRSSISFSEYGDLRMGSHGPEIFLRPLYVQRLDGRDSILTNDNSKLQIPSAFKQLNVMQKLNIKLIRELEATFSFHYSKSSSIGRYDRHLRMIDGIPRYARWDYGPQKWLMANANFLNRESNFFADQSRLIYAFQAFEESRITRNFNSPNKLTRNEKIAAHSINLDLDKKLSDRFRLFYGAELILNDVMSEGLSENIDSEIQQKSQSRYPNSKWMAMGLYGNSRFLLKPKHEFTLGLRYSRFVISSVFEQEFYPVDIDDAALHFGSLSGALGYTFKKSDKLSVYSSISSGFRAPNVDDIGKVFDSEPGSVVVPNTDLTPENAYNFEIGVKYNHTTKLSFNGSIYYTFLDNAMARSDYIWEGRDSIIYDGQLSKVQAIQNLSSAQVYGFQLSIKILLWNSFRLESHFSLQDGYQITSDGSKEPSRHISPGFSRTSLIFDRNRLLLKLSNLTQLGFDYEDLAPSERGKPEIYAINSEGLPYAPAWSTLNFNLSYQLKTNILLIAGLENMLDLRYKTYSSGLVAPGRNLHFAVKWSLPRTIQE